MDWLKHGIDLFIHIDHHINNVVQDFGGWTYLILFLIIFCETGLVVTPFLPGDSLLFAVGAVAAQGSLDVTAIFVLLCVAAVLGNMTNYWIGLLLAPKIFRHEKIPLLNKEYLARTQKFFEKHGGKTIIIARFMPIIRTFAPFLAGIGRMHYMRFMIYNLVGSVLWVSLFIFGGYFFGNMPVVKKNFSLVILAIIVISFIPGVIEFLKHRKESKS